MSLNSAPFGESQHPTVPAPVQGDSKPIVTFKAGILTLENNTLTADKQRGQLSLYDDDGVYRLEWCIRPDLRQRLSLTLIPGPNSAEFRLINSGTDARVCMLKMNDASQRYFFWIQETDTTNDLTYCKTINDAITGQLQSQSSLLHSSNNNQLTQQQFLSMLQNTTANTSNKLSSSTTATSTAPVPDTPAPTQPTRSAADATPATNNNTANHQSSSQQQQQNDASSLLSRLQAAAAQMNVHQPSESDTQPTLNDIFDTDRIVPLIQNDTALQYILLQHLPESQRTFEDLKKQLRSPQFQSTLSRLSSILKSEHYGEALQSLSLDPNTSHYGVLGFIEAIQKLNNQSRNNEVNKPE